MTGEHWAENAPLAEAFRVFDAENPQVFAELERLAVAWKDRRGTKVGIGMLWEVMRWNLSLATTSGTEPFKLNNNHRSFYARKLMTHVPAIAGLFDTRVRDERCECRRCDRHRSLP